MAGEILVALGWGKITRVCEDEGERERKRKRESYIQNSWDKAELSDLAVAMAGTYERSRKSTSRRERIRKVGYRL